VVSGFSRGVNEIFALVRSYAALIGSYRRFGTTHRSHLQRSNKEFLVCYTLEDGTHSLYRNVGNYQSTMSNISEGRRSKF